MKQYDIAISFAGEDRQIARQLANGLSSLGYRVFFDEFEAHRIWGRNLIEYLDEIFSERATYVLILISQHYVNKPWPRLERRVAQSKALVENCTDFILPVRLDDTKLPGLPDSVAYLNLASCGSEYVVEQFDRKFKLSQESHEKVREANSGDVVRLTRIVDYLRADWYGLVKPTAILDVWISYQGAGNIFLDQITINHLRSNLLSGASGPFPPSQRYKIEYKPGQITEFPLSPPLVINPNDQPEIHFEVEIYPERVVSGCSACLVFLRLHSTRGGQAVIPLVSPHPKHLLMTRLLNRPMVIDLADYCTWDVRVPHKLQGSNLTNVTLEPSGAVAVPIGLSAQTLDRRQPTEFSDMLSGHVDGLMKIALDLSERESIACTAIEIIGELGDKSLVGVLKRIAESTLSTERRLAAQDAIAQLQQEIRSD